MDKFTEALANLEQSFSHFEKVSDNYLNTLSVLAEQKRNAKAKEAAQKKLRAEYIEVLAQKVSTLWEIVMVKFGNTH